MLRLILLAICICSYPITSRADALGGLGQISTAAVDLVKYVLNRIDEKRVRDSVPNVVTAFVLLSTEKEHLAKLLDDVVAGKANQPQVARSIEDSSRKIVSSVRGLESLIEAIDPQWNAQHPDLLKAANDLQLEKAAFINNVLVAYANGQHEVRLDPTQMTELAKALHTEANKLLEEAKTLAATTPPPKP
jgi:hypothetical protein